MGEVISGPLWAARNSAANAGAGSIHDNETAGSLGFRGGTVAGSVHMNQFAPVLMNAFGVKWFETGNLSLSFKNATVDEETVQAFVEKESDTGAKVWMEREDGMLVCSGTAALGDHSASELHTKDLRPCDPAELRILKSVSEGMSLGGYDTTADSKRQFDAFDNDMLSDPLDFYRTGSHWGGPIACPSTLVHLLYGVPMQGLRPSLGKAVGLFGSIEVGHINGPLLLERDYHLESEVVCVGQSPKTEYLWFDTTAYQPDGGEPVACMRMQLRFMKASSPLYQEAS